jgi:radical SAM protein with 4Fe4S-binding SPASM domain
MILDKLLECEVFSIIYSGGEPTLYRFLPEAIHKMAYQKVEVSMISNGLLFTKDGFLQRLLDAGLTSIQISMHHFRREVNDQVTQNAGSFVLCSNGIRKALDVFGPEGISVNMVVCKPTVNDVYQMGQFLHNLGVTQFSAGMVSYSGLAAKNNLLVDKKDLIKVYRQLERLNTDLGMDVGFTGGMPLCLVPGNGYKGVVQVANVCDAAINQVVIGPNGGIRPCVEWPETLGSALTQDIAKVWLESPEFNEIREFRNTPKSCRSCGFVADCHGGCRASAWRFSGEKTGSDPLREVL